VQNQGQAIAAEHLPRLFDRFYARTQPAARPIATTAWACPSWPRLRACMADRRLHTRAVRHQHRAEPACGPGPIGPATVSGGNRASMPGMPTSSTARG
jgi:hypothetical protein